MMHRMLYPMLFEGIAAIIHDSGRTELRRAILGNCCLRVHRTECSNGLIVTE